MTAKKASPGEQAGKPLPCLGRGCPPASSESRAPGGLPLSPGTRGTRRTSWVRRAARGPASSLSPSPRPEHREGGSRPRPRGRGDAPCPRSALAAPRPPQTGRARREGTRPSGEGRPGPAPADRPGRGCQAGQGARGAGGGACRGPRAAARWTTHVRPPDKAAGAARDGAPRQAQTSSGPARLVRPAAPSARLFWRPTQPGGEEGPCALAPGTCLPPN